MALINCPECGKEISDQSVYCINCGTPVEKKADCAPLAQKNSETVSTVAADKPMKKQSNLWNIIGILVSLGVIILGVILLTKAGDGYFYISDYGTSMSRLGKVEFGADFYTEVYKAAAFTGNAVAEVYKRISLCFGFLFIALGAISCCRFGNKSAEVSAKNVSIVAKPATEVLMQTGVISSIKKEDSDLKAEELPDI